MVVRLLVASAAALLLIAAPLSNARTAAARTVDAAPVQAGTPARLRHGHTAHGRVSYYGHRFAGRRTASGERFNPRAMTMAHRTLPFGTRVRVTNVKNSKSVVVRVNDRGPSRRALIGDLSTAAAGRIGMLHAGIAPVRMQVVGSGKARKEASAKQAPEARPRRWRVGPVPLET